MSVYTVYTRSVKKMEITTKSGIKLRITITGTQEEPIIVAEDFQVQGKKVGGKATIQHWTSHNVEEGLYFDSGDVYFQCAPSMPAIRDEISKLPQKKYYIRKYTEILDSDGYQIPVQKWKFEKYPRRVDGNIITERSMTDFLDSLGITEIEVSEAEKLWNENHDIAKMQKVETEGRKRAQAIFNDDVADQGYLQACENAGYWSEENDDMARG